MTNSSPLYRARFACVVFCLCIVALLGYGLLFGTDFFVMTPLAGIALFAGLAAFRFISLAGRATTQVLDVCTAVARGDFEARVIGIRKCGELGELMWTINDMIDRADAYVRETKASMDYVSRNLYFRRIVQTGMIGGSWPARRSSTWRQTRLLRRFVS